MNRECESGKLDKIRVNLELVIRHPMYDHNCEESSSSNTETRSSDLTLMTRGETLQTRPHSPVLIINNRHVLTQGFILKVTITLALPQSFLMSKSIFIKVSNKLTLILLF